MPQLGADAHWLVLCLLICSCQGNFSSSGVEFDNLNVSPIISQAVSERIWAANAIGEKLFELPAGTANPPVAPVAIMADSRGFVYVGDEMDYTVKQFNAAGEYVTSFGEGRGVGPGENTILMSWGFLGDTLFYILDVEAKINYYRMTGSFFNSERLHRERFTQTTSLAITTQGRKYLKYARGLDSGNYFETRFEGERLQFGPMQIESGWEIDIPLGGSLATYEDKMMYVLEYYPLMMQFEPNGRLAYARTTMDYGHVEQPKYEIYSLGRKRVFTASLHDVYSNGVDGNRLYVHARRAEAMDVYDVRDGDYLYSIKLPSVTGVYVMNQRLYLVEDHGASVWALDYTM